jgi:MoaA/NifB/PqqE/SkfB family radical SAM enzyme
MKLKPKEILWEVTNKCNKNCLYCGSKDTINNPNIKELSTRDKKAMALNIVKLGPEEITFTGGEPGCVADEVIYLAKMMSEKVKSKVITNGYNIHNFISESTISAIGWSINSTEDISAAETLMNTIGFQDIQKELGFGGKITVVTNFGNHNIFQFKKLFDFIKEHHCYWQLQLTEGAGLTLTKEGILHLYDLINQYCVPCNDMGFCLADDLQITHKCSAGIHGIGITCDGYVTSCLSKRSWSKVETTEANLVNLKTYQSLSDIWASDYFNKERFGDDCECCRSKIQYPNVPFDYVPVMKMRLDTPVVTTTNPADGLKPWGFPTKIPNDGPNNPIIIMYGISPATPKSPMPYPWGEIKVYSVGDPNLDTKFKPYDPSVAYRYGISTPRDYM